jgi:hypothetical protein
MVGEIKAIFWLVLAVLAFHSFVAKPSTSRRNR